MYILKLKLLNVECTLHSVLLAVFVSEIDRSGGNAGSYEGRWTRRLLRTLRLLLLLLLLGVPSQYNTGTAALDNETKGKFRKRSLKTEKLNLKTEI